VRYYSDPLLARIQSLVEDEVREGTHSLRASYLARKYELPIAAIQSVLGDLVAIGDLQPHYQLLCSGRQQRYDADREFTSLAQIPRSEITCNECGDVYFPSEENILVSFEPTDEYISTIVGAT
jgi:hypothetical protein